MGSYTIYVNSTETQTEYYHIYEYSSYYSNDETKSDSYTFLLPDLSNATIKYVAVSAPETSVQKEGKTGDFQLKYGGTLLKEWIDSDANPWIANSLNIPGSKSSLTLSLDPTFYWERHKSQSGSLIYSRTGRKMGQAVAMITYEGESSASTVSPLSGTTIARSLSNTFSWTQSLFSGSITSQKLYWKYKSELSYREITLATTATTYTFAANTFVANSNINWYIQYTDDSGNITTSPVETVKVGFQPLVSITYPNEVNIITTNEQVFTWTMYYGTEKPPSYIPQTSYEISYKTTSATTWTVVTGTTANQYHVFAPNTFTAGSYQWVVRVTNKEGLTTGYASGTFTAVGSTAAPNITLVTNTAIPTVHWTVSNQDTFEIDIFSGEDRIYTSGVQVGANVRQFTPDILLDDGNYIVKMRTMNKYGYFTPWAEYAFVLSPTKPTAVDIMAYANRSHGIDIRPNGGAPLIIFVLRRTFGEADWTILARMKPSGLYTDNTAKAGVRYEYALRNYKYDGGFTDGTAISIMIDYKGCIIYKENDFVNLNLSQDEQFNISHAPGKTYIDSYAIGRPYPIRETGDSLSHIITISCFATFEEYEKLQEFYEYNSNLWYKDDHFSFACSINSIQITKTLLGKGYSITIELSRMNEDEVSVLE